MELYERDYYINRILSGKLKFNDLTIHSPSIDLQYEASLRFMEVLEEGRNEGLLNKNNCELMCVEHGYITPKDLELLEEIPSSIEEFQKELYLNRVKPDEARKLKKYISNLREEQSRIFTGMSKFDSYSSEGLAAFSKMQFIIRNTTYRGKKRYNFSKVRLETVMHHYSSNIIYPSTIRYIARTNPWCNKWSALKANGVVFPVGYEITDAQQLLLMWSRFYDSINESMEPPGQDVISDDDMLDGWLALQHESKAKKEKDFISKNSKIQNAQEVYIVAHNIEQAKEIDNLNSIHAKKVKQQRIETIKRQGTVEHKNLPDIKTLYIQQATAAMRGNHAGRK